MNGLKLGKNLLTMSMINLMIVVVADDDDSNDDGVNEMTGIKRQDEWCRTI